MKNNNISRKDRLKSKRQAPANYLIVCEGKKTEPNYFNGLKRKINEKYGNKVDVLIPNIDVNVPKFEGDIQERPRQRGQGQGVIHPWPGLRGREYR